MWSARPEGWLARSYRVEEHRVLVGRLEFGLWSERGALELGERRLSVLREGFWNTEHHLVEAGARRASARTTGFWRRGFALTDGDEAYHLGPSSFTGRSFELTRHGRALGQVRARGAFRRAVDVTLEERLAPELRLFALWLVILAWRRAASAVP